jgi:hypothetical protein
MFFPIAFDKAVTLLLLAAVSLVLLQIINMVHVILLMFHAAQALYAFCTLLISLQLRI